MVRPEPSLADLDATPIAGSVSGSDYGTVSRRTRSHSLRLRVYQEHVISSSEDANICRSIGRRLFHDPRAPFGCMVVDTSSFGKLLEEHIREEGEFRVYCDVEEDPGFFVFTDEMANELKQKPTEEADCPKENTLPRRRTRSLLTIKEFRRLRGRQTLGDLPVTSMAEEVMAGIPSVQVWYRRSRRRRPLEDLDASNPAKVIYEFKSASVAQNEALKPDGEESPKACLAQEEHKTGSLHEQRKMFVGGSEELRTELGSIGEQQKADKPSLNQHCLALEPDDNKRKMPMICRKSMKRRLELDDESAMLTIVRKRPCIDVR